jgi:hypothetical protein
MRIGTYMTNLKTLTKLGSRNEVPTPLSNNKPADYRMKIKTKSIRDSIDAADSIIIRLLLFKNLQILSSRMLKVNLDSNTSSLNPRNRKKERKKSWMNKLLKNRCLSIRCHPTPLTLVRKRRDTPCSQSVFTTSCQRIWALNHETQKTTSHWEKTIHIYHSKVITKIRAFWDTQLLRSAKCIRRSKRRSLLRTKTLTNTWIKLRVTSQSSSWVISWCKRVWSKSKSQHAGMSVSGSNLRSWLVRVI